jgi:hypothetical protein
MKPQPLGVSMMMNNRRLARMRRFALRQVWAGYARDMKVEVQMWKDLGLDRHRRDGVGEWLGSGWALSMKDVLRGIDDAWSGDERRREMVFTRGMVERVKRARRRKEAWYRFRAARAEGGKEGKAWAKATGQ